MDQTNVHGIHGEGQSLCLNCAEKIYGNSLEMYMHSGDIQILIENDRPTYACRGLLCDKCFKWIFSPHKMEDPWWLKDPDPQECIRLLVPFADFLETLRVDARNLRSIAVG